MGNSEDGMSIKIEKPSSPLATDQTNQANPPNIHVYPDWATMQAYYGPNPAYFNSAVASGHTPPPYMWGPPHPMMPPYGPPYAAFYPHGGVYAHPAVAIGPNSHGQGIPSSPAAGTPPSMETPTKLSGNTDHGLIKKLKGFDGLAMSIGNCNAERGAENRLSQSVDTEGSSDVSYGNTARANHQTRKRSYEGTPTTTTDGEAKTEIHNSPVSKETTTSKKTLAITPIRVARNLVGPVVSSGMTTPPELENPSAVQSKSFSPGAPHPCGVLPPEAWVQNDRELKREKRKQSNRESARRSRLRKQAETEELARKVEHLNAENMSLKSDINELTESSEKLRVENATLREKLQNTQLGQTEEIILNSIDIKRTTPVSTENLLSRVNNSSSNDRSAEEENDFCEQKPNSGAKLHQLLDTNPRADAVAAG